MVKQNKRLLNRAAFCDMLDLLCQILVDGHALAVTAEGLKADCAIDKGEQRIIAAFADIDARMDMCAALPDKNVAREDELSICTLGPKTLGFTITAVLRRTDAFFMCHLLHLQIRVKEKFLL